MSMEVRQERDRLPGWGLTGIGLGWVVLTVLAVLWAVDVLRDREDALGYRPGGPPAVAPYEIGVVDQTQIRTFHLAERHNEAGAERLHTWGWVDRERGVVHMPIGAATRVMLGEPP